MTGPLCAATGCGRPSPNAHLCPGCTARLVSTLEQLPALLADLEITATKQSRTGGGKRGSGHEHDLPYDPAAAAVYDHAVATIAAWTRHVAQSRGIRGPAHPAAAAAWLARHVEWMSHHAAAADVLTDVTALTRAILRAVDRRPDLVGFGQCQARTVTVDFTTSEDVITPTTRAAVCDQWLYGRTDRPTVTCRGCGAVHATADRDRLKQARADALVLPVALIRAALPAHLAGLLNAGTLRVWHHRGQLGEHPTGTYKVREVRELLVRLAERKAS